MGLPGWALGVILNIIGSVIINFGTNLMKLGHNKRAQAEARSQELETAGRPRNDTSQSDGGLFEPSSKPWHIRLWRWAQRMTWPIGAGLMVSGSLLTFASFSFAAQSLLAGLGSVQFVSNVVFVRFVLGETVTFRTIAATLVIIAGQMLIIIYSPHSSADYTAPQLTDYYVAPYFLAYVAAQATFVIGLAVLYHLYTKREHEGNALPFSDLVRPASYAVVSASIGTLSVLQAKCLSELLKATFENDSQMGYPFTYIVLVLWIFFTGFWLYRMNLGLKLFDGVFIIPALQVFWTFFAILDGFMFFQEYIDYPAGPLLGFICGVLVVFVGVYLLCPKSKPAEGVQPPQEQQVAVGGAYRAHQPSIVFSTDVRTSVLITPDALLAEIPGEGLAAGDGDSNAGGPGARSSFFAMVIGGKGEQSTIKYPLLRGAGTETYL